MKQLVNQLEFAGFTDHGGEDTHRKFKHKSGVNIIISGKTDADAKLYQIREVNGALQKVTKDA